MHTHKFKLGDIVHLNSNPEIKMTVYGFTISGQVAVTYFRNRIRTTSNFSSEILTLSD